MSPPPRPTRLLLFDVDGTLVHVDGAGREALRSALTAVYGRTGPIDTFDFRGRTDPEIVRGLLRAAGLEDDAIDRGLDALWERYFRSLDRELGARRDRLRTCPGVRAFLERLDADDRFLPALVTGNAEGGARRKLRACGLDGVFPFGAFGSDSERRSELPPLAVRRARERTGREFRSEEVWVIGDTPLDIACARASGVRAVAVATGRHGPEALAAHGPDALFPDLTDPDAVLDVLVS